MKSNMAECMMSETTTGEIPSFISLHQYAKANKKVTSEGGKRARDFNIEKQPSFIYLHTYAKPKQQDHVTPIKGNRNGTKRCRGTPTGGTPMQPQKQSCGGVGSTWDKEETDFLKKYLRLHPCDIPISNAYWRELASSMNKELGTSRTGASCRSYYKRNVESVVPLPVHHPDHEYDSSSISPLTQDAGSQTTLSFPSPFFLSEVENEVENDPTNLEGISALKKSAKRRTAAVNDLAYAIFGCNELRQSLWMLFLQKIEDDAKCITEKRLTYLSSTSYENLVNFNWLCITNEMLRFQPLLMDVLLSVSTTRRNIDNDDHYMGSIPELGLIYGILMKRRYKDLSRIQRFIAIALADEKVHQKVYDRLQAIGVTMSHSTVLKVQNQIGGKFNGELIDAVRSGMRFRIVGDNVNFKVGVSRERKDKMGHMEHWFGSAAIIQHTNFHNLAIQSPQKPLLQMPPSTFLPSEEDVTAIKLDCVVLVLEVLVEHVSVFSCFKPLLLDMKRKLQPPLDVFDTSKVNTVIPLPLLCKNEQKYAEVVDVLDSYEQLIDDIYTQAGLQVDDSTKVHIGGDQLTRERFSGAKRLRATALTSKEKFQHLTPITFEFFHLQMNFLTALFKLLYNKNSTEPGTLHAEKIKLRRSQVSEDVKNSYDACKELAISVTNGHMIAAFLKHFDMEGVDSPLPAAFKELNKSMVSCEENLSLIQKELGLFVEKFILKNIKALNQVPEPKSYQYYKFMCLSTEGKPITFFIPLLSQNTSSDNLCKNSCDDSDSVYDYAHLMLEMGFAFKFLLLNVNIPNRDRMLPCLKYLMCILKANNNNSKYALEILRLLAMQQSLLDEKSAHETFYSLFVNTQGKFDSSFGCDLQMEHLVRLTKEHIKSVHSNKTEKTLVKRTAAFAGMDKIACQFDVTSDCIIRSQRHKIPSANEDEKSVIASLSRIKPFDFCQGRKMDSYPKSVSSPLKTINIDHIKAWIQNHKSNFLYEFGQ